MYNQLFIIECLWYNYIYRTSAFILIENISINVLCILNQTARTVATKH